LFERFGAWLTLVGRCIPGVRTYIGFPAGIAGMNLGLFATATLVGSLVWSTILAVLGYQLASQLDTIDSVLGRFGLIVLVLAVALFIWFLKHRQKGKQT
jgi:membrane protein DedA with SNARE-associated domain